MPALFLVTAGSGDNALALRSEDLHSIGEPYTESCRSGSHRPLATRSKSAQMTAVEVADRSVALSSRILPTFFIRRRSAWRAPVRARRRDAARWTLELLGVGRTPHASMSRETCAGAWPKSSSNPRARTCGAFHRSMPAWRTCSISLPNRPIPLNGSSLPARGWLRRM